MRDRRLDFWRGLCLIDMVLVHLIWEGLDVGTWLAAGIGEYFRFAAGGFVFVAGAGVGRVFLSRACAPGGRHGAYVDLVRRAAYVLGVHYAAATSFVALEVACGRRPASSDGLALARDLLLLREAPPYGDILPLYVVLLVLTPALLELLRRGLGPVVALGSAGLFVAGQSYPWMLSPRVPEEFPVVVWQAVFVAGLFFGAGLRRLDLAPRGVHLAILGSAAAVFAVVTVAAHGPDLGVSIPIQLKLQKVPLNGAELGRYLALTLIVVLGTDLLWHHIQGRAFARFVEALGRRSLAIYVAHVWVQAAIIAVAVRFWWIGSTQAALAPVGIGVLWLLARALERPWQRPEALRNVGVTLRRGAALPAGALATILLIGLDRVPAPTADDGDFAAEVETIELDPGVTGGHDRSMADGEESPDGPSSTPPERGNDEARALGGLLAV